MVENSAQRYCSLHPRENCRCFLDNVILAAQHRLHLTAFGAVRDGLSVEKVIYAILSCSNRRHVSLSVDLHNIGGMANAETFTRSWNKY